MEYGIENSYKSWFSLKEMNFDINNPLFIQILKYAYDNNIIITLGIISEDELETGYITKIEKDTVVVDCIDMENANLLETRIINIDEIFLIEFESIDNTLLKYANERL